MIVVVLSTQFCRRIQEYVRSPGGNISDVLNIVRSKFPEEIALHRSTCRGVVNKVLELDLGLQNGTMYIELDYLDISGEDDEDIPDDD